MVTVPVLPTVHQIGKAFLVGVYTAAMTFFSGLIDMGANLEPHFADWRIAVQAGIAAALAFLGWTTAATIRRTP